MSKTQTGKLTFGPVWDFDWSMSSTYTGIPYISTEIDLATQPNLLVNGSLLDMFIDNQDNYNLLCEKWAEVRLGIDGVISDLEEYRSKIVPIAQKDARYWYEDLMYSKIVTPEDQVEIQYDYIIDFLTERVQYLTELLVETNYERIV